MHLLSTHRAQSHNLREDITATSEESTSEREILLVAHMACLAQGCSTLSPLTRTGASQRRRVDPCRPIGAKPRPRHLSVDLMDREGTIKAFTDLDTVTDRFLPPMSDADYG